MQPFATISRRVVGIHIAVSERLRQFVATRRNLPPSEETLRILFDAEWYRSRHPDFTGADPWTVFLEKGLAAGHDPGPLFSTAWYLDHYPDVAAAGVKPLMHFLNWGWKERRDPGPLFSTAWYLDHYPDVAAANINPLMHYLQSGWRERRDPSPVFDSAWYFAQYPYAEASGLDACRHFLADGAGRNFSPCRLFNTAWYRRRYVHLLHGGQNPLLHYLEEGAAAGLDPGPRFSTRQYLAAHPELQKSGRNPLVDRLAQDPARGAEAARPHAPRPSSAAVAEARAVIAEIAAIEPELAGIPAAPDALIAAAAVVPAQPGMAAWRRLYASLRTRPRAVVLAGSGEAAQEFAAVSGLLIVVTESESVAHEAAVTGADWRCLAELEDDLEMAARLRVIAALVNGLRPPAVLVAGSAAGWEMLSRHGTALARHSALFATDAPSPVAEAEQMLQRHFRSSIRALSALYGKDPERLRLLAREHGLPPSFANRLLPAAALTAPGGFLATGGLAA